MTETYIWNKPRTMGREYELSRNGEHAGRLVFEGSFTTSARVTLNANEWIFTRTGFVRPIITARRVGESADLLVATMRAGGSCDVTMSGRAYRWKATSILRGEFAWLDETGAAILRYRPVSWCGGARREIEVIADLPAETKTILMALGGYLLALHYNDVATTTAIIIASSAS